MFSPSIRSFAAVTVLVLALALFFVAPRAQYAAGEPSSQTVAVQTASPANATLGWLSARVRALPGVSYLLGPANPTLLASPQNEKRGARPASVSVEKEQKSSGTDKKGEVLLAPLAGPCAPTGITLNVPGTYATIQAAINAADPGGGDAIQVAAGTYVEQLIINKCVTITGGGLAATIIQSPATLANSQVPGVTAQSIVETRSNAFVTMSDLTITGPVSGGAVDQYGVFVIESSTLKLTDAKVTSIRKNPLDGTQNVNAVRAGSVAFNQIGALDFDRVTVSDYQKNGITVSRIGSLATINDCDVVGAGAQTQLAQNGIVISSRATATVTNNRVNGNVCNNVNCGFTQVYSFGILGIDSGAITMSGNVLDNNDAGVYSWQFSNSTTTTVSGNVLKNTRYTGILLDQGNTNVSNNYVVGNASGPIEGVGIYSFGGNPFNTVGNLQANSVTGSTQAGIRLFDDDTGDAFIPTATANFNRIAGNAAGILNTTTSSTVAQSNNFFGCNAGPGNAGCDTISSFVSVSPYLVLSNTTAAPTAVNTGGTSTVTTNLRFNSDNIDTYTTLPGNPHLPNPIAVLQPGGIPVNFSSNSFGSVSPTVTPLVDGLAQTVFTGGGPFSGNQTAVVTAAVDNAAESVNITVNDTTPPTVTINQAGGQADPTNALPINFTAVFNENVTGFGDSAGDVSLSCAPTACPGATAAVTGGPATYNIAVSGLASGQTVTATIPANAAVDPANNGNTASTSTDNQVTYSVPTLSVTAATNGAEPSTAATFTVALSAAGASPVMVSYMTASGTATDGTDYTATAGTLTFPANDNTPQTITVPVLDDNLLEGGEDFTVTLSSPVNASIATPTATGTINDNDTGGVIQFSAATYNVGEGDGTATITVTRTGTNLASGISAPYTITDGTATGGGVDYTGVNGSVTFGANETSQTFTVAITDDTIVDAAETVNLALGTPTAGATLGSPANAVLTIDDNDNGGVIEFSAATYNAGEGDGTATITVNRTGTNLASGVTVPYTITDGTANNPADYTASNATLTFGAGVASQTFTVTINEDTLFEGPETINLALGAPTGGATPGTQTTAVLTITDNDAMPSLSVDSVSLPEGDPSGTTSFVFTVTQTGQSQAAVTFDVATMDGTASSPSDFTAIPTTPLSFPGNTASPQTQTVTVLVNKDYTLEPTETFAVNLSNQSANATIGTGAGTGTIQNDDFAGIFTLTNLPMSNQISEAAGTVTVKVTRTGGLGDGITVPVNATNGTAASPADYSVSPASVSFAGGETEKNVMISVTDDGLVEGNEDFTLSLGTPAPDGSLGSPNSVLLTIVDNDAQPTVTINQAGLPQTDPTGTSPVNFTAIFSEAVTGFTASDISFTGSTTGGFLSAAVTEIAPNDGTTYNVAVAGMMSSGLVMASIPANAAIDADTNPTAASTSADNSVTFNVANADIVVSPGSPQNWAFLTETPSGTGSYVTGPATPPLGVGSANLNVNSTGGQLIGKLDYPGTRFDQITTLKYSSYQNNNTNTAAAISFQFNLDADLTDGITAFQGRLVYEPTYDTGVTVQQGVWQNWDLLTPTARFWATPFGGGTPVSAACPQAAPCTRAQLLTAFPHLGIHASPTLGAVLFKVGGGIGSPFDGNVDGFVLGINSANQTFNFEPGLTVTVEQASGQNDPTMTSPINFTATFSQPVTGFGDVAGDVILGGTAGATTAVVTGGPSVYNIAVSGMTSDGTVTASVPANAANASGNPNLVSTSTDNTVTYDMTGPSVTLNQASGQNDPTNVQPVNFTVVFSEPVTGFTDGDVNLTGSPAGATAVVTGGPSTYNVAVSGMTASGGVTAAIPMGAAVDAALNPNSASTSTDNTVTLDITPPTATIDQAIGQTDPTSTSPINFTVAFSESVSGFMSNDINVTGTAGATTAVVTPNGPAATYNVAVSGMTASGTVTIGFAAGAATDNVGNTSTAPTVIDDTVTFNLSNATFVITSPNPQGWAFYDDVNPTPLPNSYVEGPPTPPLGVGSAKIMVTSATQRHLIAKAGYGGTRLDQMTQITYGAYGNDTTVSPSFQFNVDENLNDGITSFRGRLVFEPYLNLGFGGNPASVLANTWQNWDATNGKFWATPSSPISATCTPATPCTKAQILALYPNAGIHATFGAVLFKVGNGVPSFTGNVDNFVLGINSANQTFDFEPIQPSVTINQAAGQFDPSNASPLNFTAVFSENVTGFTNSDVVITGSPTATAVVTGGPATYNVAVSGMLSGETVSVTIPAGAAMGAEATNTASTFTDNSVTYLVPTLSIAPAIGGAEPATAQTFTVTLSAAGNYPVMVNYLTASGTATDGTDYASTSGTLTFPANTLTLTQTITVPVLDDAIVEGGENFNISLGMPVNASILSGAAMGTIADDDTNTLTISSPTVTEGDAGTTALNFTVTSPNAVMGGFTVAFSVADVTTNGSDYSVVTASPLTFAGTANETQTITVNVNGDTLVEGDETLTVTLGAATPATGIVTGAVGTGTITNNDANTLTISSPTVMEGDAGPTALNFTVTSPAAVQGGFTVAFNVADGTANSGSDYGVGTSSPLTFTGAANETQTITVNVNGDMMVEGNETLTATLGTVTPVAPVMAASITSGAVGTGTITNDDTNTLAVSSPTVAEPNTGTSPMTFTVTSPKAVQGGFTVAFNVVDVTTDGSDYSVVTASPLSFAGTAGETQTITVNVNGDTLVEPDETFTVTLGAVTPVAPVLAASIVTGAVGTGTITNDDNGGTIQFSAATYSVNENGVTATITVTRTGTNLAGGVSVMYATTDGSANQPADYTTASNTLTFAAGETSLTFAVPITDDAVFEGDETVNLTLSNPTGGGSLGSPATAILTIVENETCNYMIAPTSQMFGFMGGSNSVSVTVTSGCAWTAVSNDAWITVTGGASGNGNGTVNYSVAANPGGPRTGTMTIAGQTFTVTQEMGKITVVMPTGLTAHRTDTLTVPINVTDTTGRAVLAYDFTVTYDPTVLTPMAPFFNQVGTLSSLFTVTANVTSPGTLVVSGFGTNPLTGSGVLLNLKFMVIGVAPNCSPLNFSAFQFNEGNPMSMTMNGQACVINGNITGTVNYGNSATFRPVPNTTLTAAGAPVVSGSSDFGGLYTLTGFGNGAYTVTPTKSNDVNGIASFDASLISQHLVALITLLPRQLAAADVTGNGTVSSLDASRIQSFVLQTMPANYGSSGTWRFVPVNRSYPNVEIDQTAQDYEAVLMGEVSGNWAPPMPPIAPELVAQQPQSPTAVTVTAPTMGSLPNAMLTVPVATGDLTGLGATAFDFDLLYDPAVLQPQAPFVSKTGTVSDVLTSVVGNIITPGRLRVSAFGTAPMVGAGTLVNLQFNVIGAVGTNSPLTWSPFVFNEGDPASTPVNGRVDVLGPTGSAVTVSGQVLTQINRAPAGAKVKLTSALDGGVRTTKVDRQGYYQFLDVETGHTYFLTVEAKGYNFTPPTIVITPTANAEGLNFTAFSNR